MFGNTVYTYNDRGQETRRVSYTSNGVKSEEIVYYYDSDGELVGSEYYISYESLFENTHTKYNKGKVIEEIRFDKYDRYYFKTEYTYYDNGLPFKSIVTSSYDNKKTVLTGEYEFDKYGNVILTTILTKVNGIITDIKITEKEIVYY